MHSIGPYAITLIADDCVNLDHNQFRPSSAAGAAVSTPGSRATRPAITVDFCPGTSSTNLCFLSVIAMIRVRRTKHPIILTTLEMRGLL